MDIFMKYFQFLLSFFVVLNMSMTHSLENDIRGNCNSQNGLCSYQVSLKLQKNFVCSSGSARDCSTEIPNRKISIIVETIENDTTIIPETLKRWDDTVIFRISKSFDQSERRRSAKQAFETNEICQSPNELFKGNHEFCEGHKTFPCSPDDHWLLCSGAYYTHWIRRQLFRSESSIITSSTIGVLLASVFYGIFFD